VRRKIYHLWLFSSNEPPKALLPGSSVKNEGFRKPVIFASRLGDAKTLFSHPARSLSRVNYPVAELRGIKNNYSTLCYGDQGSFLVKDAASAALFNLSIQPQSKALRHSGRPVKTLLGYPAPVWGGEDDFIYPTITTSLQTGVCKDVVIYSQTRRCHFMV